MTTYDFRNLSDHDFELVVRDLLRAELGSAFEVFMPGRDQGIDLRCISAPDREFIIQVKHYVGTGWFGLRSHLERTEVRKVMQLAPQRYGIATSVPLSVTRKRLLVDLFWPFIRTPKHVWGQGDLNSLLRDHPEVERSHFKLWLTSTEVLTAVLHARTTQRGRLVADEIVERTKLFVENSRLREAEELLSRNRVLVVSGPPGIGKTTLAEILIATLLSQGVELVVVSGDIDEALEVYRADAAQVFFYDDFLGMSTAAEVFGKNEDARLASFIRRVQNADNKYFIMTTREYLLRQAMERYVRLHALDAQLVKCVLTLTDYSRSQRAAILYNHVYFSALSEEARLSLVQDELYFRIIDAQNYTPRIIQQLVALAHVRGADNSTFGQFSLGLLANPDEIWGHTFRAQLDSVGRMLLLILLCFPRHLALSDFLAIAGEVFQGTADPASLTRALKGLDGTLLRVYEAGGTKLIAIQDPSVRDFLLSYLDETPGEILRLANISRTFEQAEFVLGLCIGRRRHREVGFAAQYREAERAALSAAQRTFFADGVQMSEPAGGFDFPLRLFVSYEGRLQTILDAAAELGRNSARWNSKACEFLQERWLQGTGHQSDAIALWESRFSLPDDVQEWLNRCEPILRTWLFEDLEDAWDFVHAYQFARSLGEEPDWIRYEFEQFLDGELMTLDQLEPGTRLAQKYEQLHDAAEQLGFSVRDDERFEPLRLRIAAIEESEDRKAEFDYERFRASRKSGLVDPVAEAREIRLMFQQLVMGEPPRS